MTGKINGMGNVPHNPKSISTTYARALKCPALKTAAVKWAFSGHDAANKDLLSVVEASGPMATRIKAKVEKISDEDVLKKTYGMIDRLHSSIGKTLNIQKPASFLEFAVNDTSHFNVNQLFSNSLACAEAITDETSLQNKSKKSFKIAYRGFRETLLVLRALEIASKEHDFTPTILNKLSPLFPQFAAPRFNVVPENYISLLDTDALLKFAYTLKCLNEINKTDIWNASLINMKHSAKDDFYVSIHKTHSGENIAIFDIARSSAVSDPFMQKDMFTGPAMRTFLENNKALINFAPAIDE